MKKPLISIIMPTYNRYKRLPFSIQSVVNQTYDNWELLIVDDGSTDNTEKLMSEYMEADSRIRYFSYGVNKGSAAARNYGIRHARGTYIAFIDSDDTWVENHLKDSMEALKAEANVSVCFSLWWLTDQKGNLIKLLDIEDMKNRLDRALQKLNPVVHSNRILFPAPDFFALSCLKTVHVCCICTMIVHRDVIQKAGMFNEELKASEDIDFIYRILYNYGFCLIMNYHFIYYKGEDNVYNFMDVQKNELENLISNIQFVRKYTFFRVNDCKMMKIRMAYIRNRTTIDCKDLYYTRYNSKIENMFFTLAYLNKKIHKCKAIWFLLKSLIYRYSSLKIKLGLHILFPLIFKNPGVTLDNLSLF